MGQFFVSSDIKRLPYCTDKRVARMPVRTKWQKYGHKKTGQTVACPRCLEVLVFFSIAVFFTFRASSQA